MKENREALVAEFPGQVCFRCERVYQDWWTPDDLWEQVVPEGGMWCPDCFTERGYVEHGMDGWKIEVTR